MQRMTEADGKNKNTVTCSMLDKIPSPGLKDHIYGSLWAISNAKYMLSAFFSSSLSTIYRSIYIYAIQKQMNDIMITSAILSFFAN